MSTPRAQTVEDLRAEQITTLREIAANPRKQLQPQRRDLLRRLGLIVPSEPPRPPREGRSNPKPRAYALTELGLRVIAESPVAAPSLVPKFLFAERKAIR